MLFAYLRIRATIGLWRAFVWLLRWLVFVAVLVVFAPVTVTAALGYLVAWLRGWPPARLRRAAACTLPMLAVWLACVLITAIHSPDLPWAIPHGWRVAWHDALAGRLLAAAVLFLPAALPAGLLIASGLWAWR